ncbi:TetR/AcrR family transcriptional regulator [Mycobacterium sp. OTB74]|uniref:TetR/AcrR family transcriptional regulator n=1 Tax=Mycobacterium sp. OTB74 TaxID=1853452 RepID=UPI002476EDBC|nr:TetR/AcrR family transcriptional regulator [Mycobacterium sp. OTB74]
MFTTTGYRGTSTSSIAAAVGIRQASLYHHFRTKDDILCALLSQTVTPTLEFIPVLAEEQPSLSPEAELHALATFGGMQLLGDRWNLGVLYLQPQLRGTGLKPLWSARERLREHYLGLARTIAADTAISVAAVDLPFRLTESLVNVWSEHRTDNAMELAMHIADAGLRVLGVPEDHIRKVRTSTRKLVGRPPHPTTT